MPWLSRPAAVGRPTVAPGIFSSVDRSRLFFSSAMAWSCALSRGMPRTDIGASMAVLQDGQVRKQVEALNTMPTSRKAARQSVGEALKSAPSTWIRPCCAGSRAIEGNGSTWTCRSPRCRTAQSARPAPRAGRYRAAPGMGRTIYSALRRRSPPAQARRSTAQTPLMTPMYPPFPIIRQLAACGG